MQPEPRDYGTQELHRQRQIKIVNKVARVAAQTPLDMLFQSLTIGEEQFLSGDRLYYLFEFSGGLRLRTHCSSDEIRGLALLDEEQTEAREKFEVLYRQAIRALPHNTRNHVINVCCFHNHVTDTRTLKEGLDFLTHHFQSESDRRRALRECRAY